jgi:hypothetical protein
MNFGISGIPEGFDLGRKPLQLAVWLLAKINSQLVEEMYCQPV